jgi:hypothetical protein
LFSPNAGAETFELQQSLDWALPLVSRNHRSRELGSASTNGARLMTEAGRHPGVDGAAETEGDH